VIPQAHHRPVRSFVRRSARMTPAQRVAIERCWPVYGLEGAGLLDLDAVFGRRVPRVMEIGFGNGEALVSLAESHPECDYLGVDVYEPGIGRLLAAVAEKRLDNVRLLRGDAVDVLPERLAPASLNAMLLFFPDPWPRNATTSAVWCKRISSSWWRADWCPADIFIWPPTGRSTPSTC
jgi:tRNA (guanine-N7-)-methyltransferase